MIGSNEQFPINLGDLLSRSGTGDRTVLIDLREEDCPVAITADAFQLNVQSFALGLIKRGIKQGDKVGFLSCNRWEMLIAHLGTMFMGAISVPINYKFSNETIRHIIADADIKLVFHDNENSKHLPADVEKICFDENGVDDFSTFLELGEITAYEPAVSDIATILYTSGSTGQPKGVPLTHKGQLWGLSKYLTPIEDKATALGSSLIVAPLYHMNALTFASACLLNAVRIILQPKFEARSYINAVSFYQCTLLTGVPTMFAMIVALDHRERQIDLNFVKTIIIGSAPLSKALLTKIKAAFPEAVISNGYGSTEAGPAIFGPHPEGKSRPKLSVGFPYDDIEWRLVDGPNENEGVLELKTPALTTGYLNRAVNNGNNNKDKWFNTKDVFHRDDDGFMYFVSRSDDMFVCGGENIFPGEVEELINRHPSVQESIIVAAPDDIKGTVPVAFVVQSSDNVSDEASIKSFCLENGPVYAHPRRIIFKDSLPLGGTFKIERRSLEMEAKKLMIAAGRATEC